MKKLILTLSIAVASFCAFAQTLQTVTDNGASTTHSINISGLEVNGTGIDIGNSHYQTGSFMSPGYKGLRLGYNSSTNNAFIAPVEAQSLGLDISTYYNATWSPKVTFKDNGNVGIGTTNPGAKLSVLTSSSSLVGKIRNEDATNGYGLAIESEGTASTRYALTVRNLAESQTYFHISTVTGQAGNVGVGTTSPSENLTVAGSSSSGNISLVPGPTTYAGYKLMLTTQAADEGFNMTMGGTKIMSAYGYNDANEVGLGNLGHENLLYLNSNGNVGIGTKSPDTKLTVNGTIHSTEVKVESTVPTPDYVFEPDYQLPSLTDIKRYVDQNHHLPNIPSAKEIEKDGIKVGDMSMKLLKTIEELTLHVIELNNQVKAQSEKITSLENQLKK